MARRDDVGGRRYQHVVSKYGAIKFTGFDDQEVTAAPPFLIVEDVERTAAAVTSDPDSDDSDDDELEHGGTDVRQFIEKDAWRLGQSKLIISVVYDIQNFFMNRRLLKSVLSHLVKAAAAEGVWLTTGGTRYNEAARYIGEEVRSMRLRTSDNPVVIGFAKLTDIINHQQLRDKAYSVGKEQLQIEYDQRISELVVCRRTEDDRQLMYSNTDLEPHHTHFILHDGTSAATEFRFNCERKMAPVVVMVIEGGSWTFDAAYEAIKAGTPLLVFAGSGKAADFIAAAYDRRDQPNELNGAKMKEMTGSVEKGCFADDLITKVKEMVSKERQHLINVYRISEDSLTHNIAEAILSALLKCYEMDGGNEKKKQYKWKRCAELAIAWNCSTIARRTIFNNANYDHWRVRRERKHGAFDLHEALFNVLVDNKVEFVQLFMERVNLNEFLDQTRLADLYQKTLTRSNASSQRESLREFLSCLVSKHGTSANQSSPSRLLNELSDDLYDKEDLDHPYRELFVWSVFFRRIPLAMTFWRDCPDQIGSALVASTMLTSLAREAKQAGKLHLARELKSDAREFVRNGSGLLGELYEIDQERSHELLTRPLETWNRTSVFELADNSTLMDFMEHDCCQTKLDKIWHGRLAVATYTRKWQILLSLICPILILFLIKTDDETDVKSCSPPNYNNNNDNTDNNYNRLSNDDSKRGSVVVRLVKKTFFFYTAPIVKFCCHSISYLVLLGLYSYFMTVELRPYQPSLSEILVWIWSATLWLEELRQMQPLRKQFRSYIRDPWNRIDQAMYLILLLAVVLRFTLPNEHFVGARYVYAINLVMFYLRVLQLYYIHRRLGPKVVVIWRMVIELIYFALLCVVFLFAYGVAAHSLLYPHSDDYWSDILYNIFYQPYLSLFQEFGNEKECSHNKTAYANDPSVSRCPHSSWLTVTLFLIYIMMTAIMLINLLIAIFSNAYERVEEQGIKTWSFYRYSLTVEYADKPPLAPPLIVVNLMWRIIAYLFNKCHICRCDACNSREPAVDDTRRLMEFERAGTETYLYGKHCREERRKADRKTDTVLQGVNELKSLCSALHHNLQDINHKLESLERI